MASNVMVSADEIVTDLENTLATKMKTKIAPQKALLDDAAQKLAELKKQVKLSGASFTIPESVYEKIGQMFYEDLTDAGINVERLSTNPIDMVRQIGSLVSSWTDSKSATVDDYLITYSPSFGSIDITYGTDTASFLISNEQMYYTALKNYCLSLSKLAEDVKKATVRQVISGCVSDAVSVVRALYTDNSRTNVSFSSIFKTDLTKSIRKKTVSDVEQYIKNSFSDGDSLVSALKDFAKIQKKYDALSNAYAKGKSTTINNKAKSFVKACNKVTSDLGEPMVELFLDDKAGGIDYMFGIQKVRLNDNYSDSFSFDGYNYPVWMADASERHDDITIVGNKKSNVIYGGAGDDVLSGGKGKDEIKGNAGDDTIYGGAGNDTLDGGAGDDYFCISVGDGKDVVTDYTEDDVIQIVDGALSKVEMKNSDVIISIGKGFLGTGIGKDSVTIKNGKDKYITIVDADEDELIYLNGRQVDMPTAAMTATMCSLS